MIDVNEINLDAIRSTITFRLIHMAIMSDCAVKFSGRMENIVKAFACAEFLKRGDLGSVSPFFIY